MLPQYTNKAQPQRISRASIAVITRTRSGHTEWLLQWNAKWQAMNLIAGHKEAIDTNDLTCLVREIHEELFEELSPEELTHLQIALSQENDVYICANSAWQDAYIDTIRRIGDAPFEYDDFSASAKCLTHYMFNIYKVKLQANMSLFQDNSCVEPTEQSSVINEWVSVEDIRYGLTVLGFPISKTVTRILIWIQTQNLT